jgi:hypothetical protein
MTLSDLFENKDLKAEQITCHSGGAEGADTEWEISCIKVGIKVNAYSYKTKYHTTKNKVEISDVDYLEGIEEIKKANRIMKRGGIGKYMNLLARNWSQVKYSEQIFAIGQIVEGPVVDGGTGWAVMMGILNNKEVFVFDQIQDKWFIWSDMNNKFIEYSGIPKITTHNFAGIGTRKLKPNGLKAINDVIGLIK